MKWRHFLESYLGFERPTFTRKKPHRCLLPEKFSEKSSFQTDIKKVLM
jgi:hypothetical protein